MDTLTDIYKLVREGFTVTFSPDYLRPRECETLTVRLTKGEDNTEVVFALDSLSKTFMSVDDIFGRAIRRAKCDFDYYVEHKGEN